jgi:hypothetical protein
MAILPTPYILRYKRYTAAMLFQFPTHTFKVFFAFFLEISIESLKPKTRNDKQNMSESQKDTTLPPKK